jgi:sugar fermentation stimulation protein A
MKYKQTIQGIFLERPNRFIAYVLVEGVQQVVHVKNTGRCRELLLPGTKVILEVAQNPNRKTKYDLIAVYKEAFGLINIDSQAPNRVVAEWLSRQDYDYIKPEFSFGNSRMDFYMEKGTEKYLLEVKGCTLEREGVGYFPDAPTERGTKHLHELTEALNQGYHSMLIFVIQMEGVTEVYPNRETDPAFGEALDAAETAGVQILRLPCKVRPDALWIPE